MPVRGDWVWVRAPGALYGAHARVDEVLESGRSSVTLFGTDGKAQLSGLLFDTRDLEVTRADVPSGSGKPGEKRT